MAEQSRIEKFMASLTEEEKKEFYRKAGQASVEARAQKKEREHTISAALKELMTEDHLTEEMRERLFRRGVVNPDGAMAVAIAVHDRASLTGDPAAARFVAEYTDGKPADKVQISGLDGKPIEAIDLTKLTDDQLQELIAKRS
jgi:DNA-binding TFAR19-related protein (PDSD5 family)